MVSLIEALIFVSRSELELPVDLNQKNAPPIVPHSPESPGPPQAGEVGEGPEQISYNSTIYNI